MDLSSLALNPLYVAPSAWWQHVPIAHWLVANLKPRRIVELGTHYGVSFFSFCEAAQAFSPDTFVYAVDTWKGDDHASYYEHNVFDKVEKHWQDNHRLRSRLIRSTFDDAIEYFEDESIDILHIDGLHTYEAVKHDYETWLPKLSKNHVVLFHDINVRERGFGVWKLWQEIKPVNTTLEVSNGHGLGLLITGEDVQRSFAAFPDLVRALQAKGELLEKLAQLTPGGDFHGSAIDHARAELEQARLEVEQARAEAEQARLEAEQARAEAEQAKALADQAIAEAAQAKDQAESSNQRRKQIEDSRFWALTSPLRKSLDAIKSLMPQA